MPIKFKTPKVKAKKSVRRETKTQEAHAKMKHTLESLAEQKNQVAVHLLQLWDESEHIRVMIDYGGNDATERFVQSHPDVTTKPTPNLPVPFCFMSPAA